MSNQDGPIRVVPDGDSESWPRNTEIIQVNTPEAFNPPSGMDESELTARIDSYLSGDAPDIELDEKTGDVIFSFPREVTDKLHKQYAIITGKAGTGKSTLMRLEDEKRPRYIEKGSTTGIAAINCGGKTINSLLRYFNTESLGLSYKSGKLHFLLRNIRAKKKVLGVDECSMLDAKQLDIIITALDDIAQDDIYDDSRQGTTHQLGLHLIGDFCQLPPVNAEFCFKSRYWKEYFEPNVIKLETIWRQDDEAFVNAINAMREGDGKKAVKLLKQSGVLFTNIIDNHFNGTTLIPNNSDVDTYNSKRLAELTSTMIRFQPVRRGSQAKEWDKNSKGIWGIPFEQRFKVGSYVMILRNDTRNFEYVNGDCGEIVDWNEQTKTFKVKLVRNSKIVYIKPYIQFNYQYEQPSEGQFTSMFHPYQDNLTGYWVTGSIEWMPLRLAYASTIHKSQGLSLDRVQVDSRPDFYGYPSMSYVAISRCKTPQGLIIVGNEYDFANKVVTNKEVLRWV